MYYFLMDFSRYFSQLADWKRLPAYKAETRIDSLVGYYLADMLSDFLHVPIVGLIPELPIRLATVKPRLEGTPYAERSFKVDFLAVAEHDICYLVEFKTDSSSRRDAQDTYLLEAQSAGVAAIVAGIERIAQVSTYKQKYGHLLAKLQNYGLQSSTVDGRRFEIVYVQPANSKAETQVVDFLWMANWLEARPDDAFGREFAKALRSWAND